MLKHIRALVKSVKSEGKNIPILFFSQEAKKTRSTHALRATLALSHISRPKTRSPNTSQNMVHDEATAIQILNPKRILATYSSTTLSLFATTSSSSREDDDEK
jgi:hypothetical protein